jgi:hypothetical protein
MMDGCWLMSPSSLFERRRALGFSYFASLIKKMKWWSQAESNRRPLECHLLVTLYISMG